MSITVDSSSLERASILLDGMPMAAEKAISASLNRAILASRTALSKGVREIYTIKASDVKSNMTMKKSTAGTLTATLTVKGSPIPLTNFSVSVRKGDISARVKKGGGGSLPHSFFVVTKGVGIYHREASSRLPIQQEFGPSAPQMAGEPGVIDRAEERAQEVFESRLEHEIYARLEGFA